MKRKARVSDYERIETAIRFIEGRFRDQPTLGEIASHVHLSSYHFQRLFRRWAGVSPKRFLQYLTVHHAQHLLRQSRSLLDVAHDTGLSGSGRLHDLLVNMHAVTPGEWKRLGTGLTILYGFHASPFGECLIALTERGICGLAFVAAGGRTRAIDELQAAWPGARLRCSESATHAVGSRIFTRAAPTPAQSIDLFVRGSNFQIKVWEALMRIPSGALVSYNGLAGRLGNPRAARAVARAVARNPVGILIPCHRVIRSTGAFGDYHWGEIRKKAILARESAHADRR
ncbi:MAG: methylated-DNA--[protein]-cysteine S-methyltransferase [Acidiferrobacterales bacterium]